MTNPEDRRRFGRIHFDEPIAARLGDTRVQILDVSLAGARIASAARFAPGAASALKFNWDDKPVEATSAVIRCTLYERDKYQTGLRFDELIGDSHIVIREMIATHVFRALEEQKANAHGIPPVGPYVHVEGKLEHYRRCEFTDGRWKRISTTSSMQPVEGFTISAEVAHRYVDLLCETYEKADAEGRRLTRILAQLSINKAEGVPTRRYIP